MSYDSRPDTEEHIEIVRGLIGGVVKDLTVRGHNHDRSKLRPPEVEAFNTVTEKLRGLTYGSPEYEEARKGMGPALEHHYAVNDHHPEHFGEDKLHDTFIDFETEYLPGGEITVATGTCDSCDWLERGDEADVNDARDAHEREASYFGGVQAMNLLQITEMLCDWIAASRRHDNGDIHRSIDQNASRFGYSEELEGILHRSVDAILASELGTP